MKQTGGGGGWCPLTIAIDGFIYTSGYQIIGSEVLNPIQNLKGTCMSLIASKLVFSSVI